MRKCSIEPLESRRLLSATLIPLPETPVPNAQYLTPLDVQAILARAISSSIGKGRGTEVAVVVDREGSVLGMLASGGAESLPDSGGSVISVLATIRARTAAFFESNGEAFTTRTARFIIQNHFPPGIDATAGGPLYGVEFSDLINSDILPPSLTPGVSGDPGGVPLYINKVAVGAIGVAGDFHDVAATKELLPLTQLPAYNANPKGRAYSGHEGNRFRRGRRASRCPRVHGSSGHSREQYFRRRLALPVRRRSTGTCENQLLFR